MEFLYTVLIIFIIYLIISQKRAYELKIEQLHFQVVELQRLIKQLIDRPYTPPPVPEIKPEVKAPEPVPVPAPQPKPQVPETPIFPQTTPQEIYKPKEESIPAPRIEPPVYQEPKPQPPVAEPRIPKPSFFERHPDLEKFIGENLINKIGIAILVLAIGYFVKYAIDNNWVGPVGRVGIGVLCGAILVGIAHRLRNTFKSFSSVLVGGGLAVFYFTITLAYHQFHLFNQTAAFIILIIITVFAVVLSLLYNRQELAVIALVGGLASPFMVSNGSGNYHALFIYLIILNAGLLAIAYYKLWRILNIVSFALTVIICSAVLLAMPATVYVAAFWYCTVLYLMFFAINVANNIKENKAFIGVDFSILLINTSLYFAAGLYLLTAMQHAELRGLFSASLAVMNLALSFILFKLRKTDSNVLYLLIGITLTFISLTAPIQLHGHYITMFWAAETVLLYWLYLKSGIKLMRLTSIILWGAMLISLLLDWSLLYSSPLLTLNVIANKGFITTLVTALGSYGVSIFMAKDDHPEIYSLRLNHNHFKYAAIILLFMSGLLEINHQFLNRYGNTSLNTTYLMLYVPAFACLLYLVLRKAAFVSLSKAVWFIIFTVAIVVYLLNIPSYFYTQADLLVHHRASRLHFAAHWVSAVIIGMMFYRLTTSISETLKESAITAATWLMPAAITLFLSFEVCLLSNSIFYSPATTISHIETIYIKTGLPVLWGLISFALMWLGMRHKLRSLRVISLTLFSITLLKLFIFDIRNIPPAGKIAAFFCLGVLLLIISFMYQKVKKIIADDNETPTS
ncbi:DUF2339 domain-containing protein [Mucilaginibacter aquatilis]|uniref:DUF2339 domain-containing protein n=1 Tax=Mucilaginibacter aquatilis TaxID=1517760 RepID=A0A6I4I5W9_9SPHI|nr:DUF2339 domain-containing protein [Mucilaginibacter aquatilis]MVN90471.1 DUF2339 domain-containing protein [Mucilaginibacter aquatilis]